MYNFLDGFEKRMETIGIVESVINRKNRNMELEKLFENNDFTNIVFTVLLYIMEKTLSEDSDCDRDHIMKFIGETLPTHFNLQLTENQLNQVTNYIIKNVLQNEGVPYYYQSIDYINKTRKNITIRLISDHVIEEDGGYRITYSLTDQAYDFLFRTKEVDQEIKMTIEELKLKELIKRKNFKKAHDQSLNLIQMVRQKKKEIQIFMMKIKENIHDVDIDEFEKLINSTYDLLNEEYDLLSEIMEMSNQSENKIRQEFEASMHLDESLKKAQTEIKQINYNIKATLSEQKDLILSRQSLSKVYIDTMGESFVFSMEKRFDIEEEILQKMEQHIELTKKFWQLLNPIFLPNSYRNLNIRSLYEPQGMIKLGEEEKIDYIEKEVLTEDREKERVEKINQVYIDLLKDLIQSTLDHNGIIHLQDYIDGVKQKESQFHRFVEDRLLFTTILKLYDIGSIDITAWMAQSSKVVMNLSEEFNLEYCLSKLIEETDLLSSIQKIEITKPEQATFEVEIKRTIEDQINILEKVELSNFTIKVVKNNE